MAPALPVKRRRPAGMADAGLISELRVALSSQVGRVVDLFREWDENADGKVSKKEFRRALPMLGLKGVPAADADALFDSLDPDGSGEIEYKELNKLLRKGVELDDSLKVGAAGEIETKATTRFAVRDGSTLGRGTSMGKIDLGVCRAPRWRFARRRAPINAAALCTRSTPARPHSPPPHLPPRPFARSTRARACAISSGRRWLSTRRAPPATRTADTHAASHLACRVSRGDCGATRNVDPLCCRGRGLVRDVDRCGSLTSSRSGTRTATARSPRRSSAPR